MSFKNKAEEGSGLKAWECNLNRAVRGGVVEK